MTGQTNRQTNRDYNFIYRFVFPNLFFTFRQRLSQLQLMALILVYVRKTNYFEKRKSIFSALNLKGVFAKN